MVASTIDSTAQHWLPEHVRRWVTAGIVSDEEAVEILAFEHATPGAAPRIPLVTEVLSYLGSAIAVSGVAFALGQGWNDIPGGVTIAFGLAVAVGAYLVGARLVRIHEEAALRLASFAWLISAGGLVLATGTTAYELDAAPDVVALCIGLTALVYGAVLWRGDALALQLLTVGAGAVTTVLAALAIPDVSSGWAGVVLWALGIVAAVLAARRLAPPVWLTWLGALGLTLAGAGMMTELGMMIGLTLGLVTAMAAVGIAIAVRQLPLLGGGGIGVMIFLQSILAEYFGDTPVVPLGLTAVGVGLVGLGLLVLRRRTQVGEDQARRAA
jgi:hypothetical protein